MRGINLHFESFEALSTQLEAKAEEQELASHDEGQLRDGEWLLATLHVADESIAVAGRALDRGTGLCLTFENRDWQKIRAFAEGVSGPCSAPPSSRGCEPRLSAPPGSSVLVVDDDPDIRTVVSALLRGAGFDTESVESAEGAFDRLRQHTPDLLLVDWNLPGISGVELCARLRKDPTFRRLPVLFLTAHSSTEDVVTAFSVGADDFVCKPFRAPELGARVLGLLRRARLSEPAP